MRAFAQGVQRVAYEDGALIASMTPTDVDALSLGAGVAKRYTIPTGVKKLMVVSDKDLLVKEGDSTVVATLPVADVTNGTAPMLNPGLLEIPSGVTHISVYCASACIAYIYRWT